MRSFEAISGFGGTEGDLRPGRGVQGSMSLTAHRCLGFPGALSCSQDHAAHHGTTTEASIVTVRCTCARDCLAVKLYFMVARVLRIGHYCQEYLGCGVSTILEGKQGLTLSAPTDVHLFPPRQRQVQPARQYERCIFAAMELKCNNGKHRRT